MDGLPADLLAGDLRQRQARFEARSSDGTRPEVNTQRALLALTQRNAGEFTSAHARQQPVLRLARCRLPAGAGAVGQGWNRRHQNRGSRQERREQDSAHFAYLLRVISRRLGGRVRHIAR
jgi:hypothetical protein